MAIAVFIGTLDVATGEDIVVGAVTAVGADADSTTRLRSSGTDTMGIRVRAIGNAVGAAILGTSAGAFAVSSA